MKRSLRIRSSGVARSPATWMSGGRKLRYIGQARNRAWFKVTAAVYNVIRITALDPAPA